MMAATHVAIMAVSASVREKDEEKKAEMRKVTLCVIYESRDPSRSIGNFVGAPSGVADGVLLDDDW